MTLRLIALIVSVFLFFSTLESWAYWLAGRWFVSSRYASLSLAVVKRWLDRGIISSSTRIAKVFINRYGKMILMTLALSEVLRELEDLQRQQGAGSICYLPTPTNYSLRVYVGSTSSVYFGRSYYPGYTYTVRSLGGQSCNGEGSVPTYRVYRYDAGFQAWVNSIPGYEGWVPVPGTYKVGSCEVEVELKIPPCPFSASPNQSVVYAPAPALHLERERRDVPVRVYPNPADFVRPDVIESDPALRYLRDEYNRIAQDTSIPVIPSDALSGVELPSIGWTIPPEEAIDTKSESSQDKPSTYTSTDKPADQPADKPSDEAPSVSVPGFDTSLPSIERKPFPFELIDSLVQNHPLLKVIRNINFDAGIGGSCVIGSGTFTISFCEHTWILNLMGAIIVPVAFLVGLFGRND